MAREIIKLENVSRSFNLPHLKKYTLKEHFVDLFKRTNYEEFYALKDINLSINEGESIGIIGRNGSGKSTLLRLIAGIYPPTNGSVRVQGKIAPFIELGVGFEYDLSGRDNIYLYGAILGLSRQEIERRFDDIVDYAELAHFIDQKLKHYSSGMQARLAFSILVHVDADILLIDEALATGDEAFQNKCLITIKELKNQNKTILFVSHNLKRLQDYCDHILWLERGSMRSFGASVDVIKSYAETFL